jgi:hypothetical protein
MNGKVQATRFPLMTFSLLSIQTHLKGVVSMKSRRFWEKALVAAAAIMLAALPAQASVGTAFTYQGQLKQGVSPVNDTVNLAFTLWDAASGGTQIGSTVTTLGVPVTNGLFTVVLDFGEDCFKGDARWLEITVNTTTLAPRQELTPAPYALALPGLWTQQGAATPSVIGGYTGNNIALGVVGATISGGGEAGHANCVTDNFGTVGGGRGNLAGNEIGDPNDAQFATVGGGASNQAQADYATVGGGHINTAAMIASTVAGGSSNWASANYATVGGGSNNQVTSGGDFGAIGGGKSNTVTANWGTIAGGEGNGVYDQCGTIGGGKNNQAGSDDGDPLSAYFATVAGGKDNSATGRYSTVPGGEYNVAAGAYSFAAGRRAKADHDGAFVWADSNDQDFASTSADEFSVRCTGGARFMLASGDDSVQLPPGGGGWSTLSDRNLKENFITTDGKAVLARLAQVPISTWNYKAQDASIRHMGPMAQDFHAAFGLGEDDRHISTVDADGVALAAIQGLREIVQEKDAEISDLRAQLERLEAIVTASDNTQAGGER